MCPGDPNHLSIEAIDSLERIQVINSKNINIHYTKKHSEHRRIHVWSA